MTLPYDYARCPGTGSDLCKQCARTNPWSEWQSYIAPQFGYGMEGEHECPNYIEKDGKQ